MKDITFPMNIRSRKDIHFYRRVFFELFIREKDSEKKKDLTFVINVFDEFVFFKFYKFKTFREFLSKNYIVEEFFITKKQKAILFDLQSVVFC